MKRWVAFRRERAESPRIDRFLDEIERVCRKHGLSIGHEDAEGAFTVGEFNKDALDWIREAYDYLPGDADRS